VDEFALFSDWQDRYEHLIELGKDLPADRTGAEDRGEHGARLPVSRVAECRTSKRRHLVHFTADSDAMITKGLVALLVRVLNDRTPQEILVHARSVHRPSACAST
jgi:cysteine desulfuration protein SufE